MKITKMKSNLSYVNEKPCVTIYAFFKTDDGDKKTACGQIDAEEDILFVYDGYINTDDPGEDPEEEYSDRDEALDGEYGEVFTAMYEKVAEILMNN